ncbi:Outer membrane protein OprM precursor [Limihaloglobus sulfuriphilus]|uniref:Outer membrane protein OprM n=2 Tax=Limihaloglobus sulfuriphilus TaxID=1851148 RepID=A0A1Q2MAY0_9BACT|nr:Outer membrane protein OprM precursor [Limihaloglobus sulfuriphilus]
MNIKTIKIISLTAAVMFFVSGCSLGPDYERPETQLPQEWLGSDTSESANPEVLREWWKSYDDPMLGSLLERADADNLDLQAAMARIEQSRAFRAYASGEKLPSVDAFGNYTRSRSSQNIMGAAPGENSFYSAGFDAFWELDLFGRIRRSIESAQAELERSVEDYRNTRVSLFAEIARNYIELQTSQARIEYARTNIEIQRKTLDLTQNRYEADLVPKLDVSQARLNLANSQSEIPSLRIAETEAVNRLSVLTGTTPDQLRSELIKPRPLMQIEVEPLAGIPAELLRRRPDIRSAERALAAQTARIGQAEALRYPSFSLSGSFGLAAMHYSDLTSWDSRNIEFGPSVRWTIFDSNRLKSLVAVEEALTKQLAANYESAVLRAVEEVENALVGFAQETRRTKALERSVQAAQESLKNVETLYENGLTDFQNVLDVQRSLSLQQDRLAVSRGLILQRSVAIYKALGGGWDSDGEQPQTNSNK